MWYWICTIVSDQFIVNFVVCVVLLALDFWVVSEGLLFCRCAKGASPGVGELSSTSTFAPAPPPVGTAAAALTEQERVGQAAGGASVVERGERHRLCMEVRDAARGMRARPR